MTFCNLKAANLVYLVTVMRQNSCHTASKSFKQKLQMFTNLMLDGIFIQFWLKLGNNWRNDDGCSENLTKITFDLVLYMFYICCWGTDRKEKNGCENKIGPGGLRAPCVAWPLLLPSFSLSFLSLVFLSVFCF